MLLAGLTRRPGPHYSITTRTLREESQLSGARPERREGWPAPEGGPDLGFWLR